MNKHLLRVPIALSSPYPMPFRRLVLAAACALMASPSWAQSTQAAWTSEADYDKTLFVTPGGDPTLSGPMLYSMIGGGDSTYEHASNPAFLGGGRYTKAGVSIQLYYSRETDGPDTQDPEKHMRFYINHGRSNSSMPLPPDVNAIEDLPDIVRFGMDPVSTDDDLSCWATTARFPRTLAALEWARYLNVPITIQLQGTYSQGGKDDNTEYVPNQVPPVFNPDTGEIDAYIESQGKDQCVWDVADICDPNDDEPASLEPSGVTWAEFSFACPTLADPQLALDMGETPLPYQGLVRRNLEDAITQLLAVASDPRYAGRLAAIAIDSEIHMPSSKNVNYTVPALGGGVESRYFFDDYHPVMVRQFAYYLRDQRYNGDLNAFWADFGADYSASGGFGHVHTKPTTWEEIDPPRNYPTSVTSPRSAYWHEWCNFQTLVLEDFLESLVDTAVAAGVPPTRIFTHQTPPSSSYNENRATSQNRQRLDDWIHVETSLGRAGLSMYGPKNILGIPGVTNTTQYALYENLARRDDAWGSPEYNPWITDSSAIPPLGIGYAATKAILDKAWNYRAQVLWMHNWGDKGNAAADAYTHYWVRDPATLVLKVPGTSDLWTANNLSIFGGTLKATTANNSYMQWTGAPAGTFSYEAEDFPCIAVLERAYKADAADDAFDMRVEFLKNGTWHLVTKANWMRYETDATQWWGLDLSREDPVNYTGTISGLRFHPVGARDRLASVHELALFGYNDYTSAMQDLLTEKRDTPRPVLELPDLQLQVGARFDTAIAPSYGQAGGPNARLVVYGNDPDATNLIFDKFDYQGNFYPSQVECGEVTFDAIRARPSRLMGQRKTGRFRQITLPGDPNLKLRFAMGISGELPSDDGVLFRVLIRDFETRVLDVVFSEVHRTNTWAMRDVDLSQYAGRKVDVLFETSALSNDFNDEAAWARPTLISSEN